MILDLIGGLVVVGLLAVGAYHVTLSQLPKNTRKRRSSK